MTDTNIISLDMDHIYLNINVQNQSYTNGVEALLTKTFREPIVENPSLYDVSVVKMEIPATYIPLFDFATYIKPPLTSPTTPQAELVITFTYLGVDYTSKLTYTPGLAPPSAIISQRFPVYTIDQFVNILNNGFQSAYTQLTTAVPALIAVLQGPPVVAYDPIIRIFSTQYPLGYNSVSGPVQVWMNDNLYNMLDTLPYRAYDDTDGSNGYKNNQMFIDTVFTFIGSNLINRTNAVFQNQAIASPLNNIVYYNMIQEISSIPSIYSVNSIIVTSNLPTVPEYINTVNTATSSLTSQDAIIQFPILTEISPLPGDTEQRILYVPTADFRFRNLSSSDPITNLQLQVFYQDKSGLIQPLRVPSREGFNIKILFRKKTYQNSMLYYINGLPDDEKKRIIQKNFIKRG